MLFGVRGVGELAELGCQEVGDLLPDVDRVVADALQRPRDEHHPQHPLAQAWLAHDLDHERQLGAKYERAIAAADALGEIAIRALLEGILGSEQNTMQEIERMTETP